MSFSYWFITIYKSATSDKTIVWIVIDILIGFSPVFIWLTIFKSAGSIPVEWRPEIKVKLVPILDDWVFNPQYISSWMVFSCILSVNVIYLTFRPRESIQEQHKSKLDDLELAVYTTEQNRFRLESTPSYLDSSSATNPLTFPTSPPSAPPIGLTVPLNQLASPIPLLILLTVSWPALNLLYLLATSFQNPILDITAFISYVICHLAIPISTSVYLYIVHPSGDLKRFSMNLGIQNILAVITHLSLPSSPPWFIHLYGINAHADYGTLGYAAGLIRVDTQLGTHLSTDGFHKSPIVFGACPSVHSATAICCLLWIACHRQIADGFSGLKIVQITARVIVTTYVFVQWWATMYLDHHWRIDLLVGMFYSVFTFLLIHLISPSDEKSLSFGQRLFQNNRETPLASLFYQSSPSVL